MNRFKFFDNEDDLTIENGKNISDKEHKNIPLTSKNHVFKAGEAKYRSEQLVLIKVDGIIENHAETKLEYKIEKIVHDDQFLVKVNLTDQIVNMQPNHLQEGFDLMSKIDLIKSNARLLVNQQTGKIASIENIDEIRNNWFAFKQEVEANTSFVKSEEMKTSIANYLSNTELQFTNENLLQDFQVRPFFELFFSAYLISDKLAVKNETKLYYSQLFDRLPVELDILATIVNETPDTINILKDATLNRENLNLSAFVKIYDERYKPRIGYKFDEYSFEHHTQVSYNLKDNLLADATMNIVETVKNNIEVFVDYKLMRID
ncbi:hypothetical protein [Pedobacter cryoconitis]|uniref:Uncharacterized protein n=1 Tax=Pedobacter cryoconitis TaxID=188932 RepID=A0A327SSK5_9SPHI|nr:hypothetical protein [Pedobacter cryoconitis]RAJ31879.1 hypothetical protein LY11_02036 [Pedobacter cryoconitis]